MPRIHETVKRKPTAAERYAPEVESIETTSKREPTFSELFSDESEVAFEPEVEEVAEASKQRGFSLKNGILGNALAMAEVLKNTFEEGQQALKTDLHKQLLDLGNSQGVIDLNETLGTLKPLQILSESDTSLLNIYEVGGQQTIANLRVKVDRASSRFDAEYKRDYINFGNVLKPISEYADQMRKVDFDAVTDINSFKNLSFNIGKSRKTITQIVGDDQKRLEKMFNAWSQLKESCQERGYDNLDEFVQKRTYMNPALLYVGALKGEVNVYDEKSLDQFAKRVESDPKYAEYQKAVTTGLVGVRDALKNIYGEEMLADVEENHFFQRITNKSYVCEADKKIAAATVHKENGDLRTPVENYFYVSASMVNRARKENDSVAAKALEDKQYSCHDNLYTSAQRRSLVSTKRVAMEKGQVLRGLDGKPIVVETPKAKQIENFYNTILSKNVRTAHDQRSGFLDPMTLAGMNLSNGSADMNVINPFTLNKTACIYFYENTAVTKGQMWFAKEVRSQKNDRFVQNGIVGFRVAEDPNNNSMFEWSSQTPKSLTAMNTDTNQTHTFAIELSDSLENALNHLAIRNGGTLPKNLNRAQFAALNRLTGQMFIDATKGSAEAMNRYYALLGGVRPSENHVSSEYYAQVRNQIDQAIRAEARNQTQMTQAQQTAYRKFKPSVETRVRSSLSPR